MGGAVSSGIDHDDLIDKLMAAEYIKTSSIELVFRAVDRAFYFLPDAQDSAYKDLAWKKGNIHISAPCIYGEVMESLHLNPGMSFLNIGSGTGYLSTMAGLILGPYGINHGIELYEDVVEYAYSKLNEFRRSSPALDCYEFCDPIFVKGNSLCLSSASRQYDRVYCGAACPENHENYMKNLLKVGGILVVPLNDQLVQITRKSETTWESRAVLPVSFSTLQLPSSEEVNNTVTLPEVQPLLLQEACRAAIRSILRRKAQEEHPGVLVIRKRRIHPPRHARSKMQHPKLVIPILEMSDDEGALGEFGFSRLLLSRNGISGSLGMGPMAVRSAVRVIDIARTLTRRRPRVETSQSLDEDGDSSAVEEEEENDEEAEGRTLAARRFKIPKREKFDSGVCTDMDNGQEVSSSTESELSSENEEEEGNDDMEIESDSDCVTSQSYRQSKKVPVNEEKDVLLYSVILREKIQALPLPPSLKLYLNYYREF